MAVSKTEGGHVSAQRREKFARAVAGIAGRQDGGSVLFEDVLPHGFGCAKNRRMYDSPAEGRGQRDDRRDVVWALARYSARNDATEAVTDQVDFFPVSNSALSMLSLSRRG